MSTATTLNIALAHDDLIQSGGAERLVAVLHTIWPKAPLFTSVYDPESTLPEFAAVDVRTSFLQRTPFRLRRFHKLALPLFPAAFERLDLSGYDVVLSSSARFAQGVRTGPETCHICYCNTPSRFVWRPQVYFERGRSERLLWPLLWPLLWRLRAWDRASAAGVDYYIANSHNVAGRIREAYGRESTVIEPPVETARFRALPPDQIGDYFLVVSRLVGYKRVDLAIEACNRLGVPLRVVGGGPDEAALRRRAGPTVRFLGRASDQEVADLYAGCKAFILPGEEDFGISPLEAMASGRPVVAFGAGGALETVVAGKTGLFFEEQTVASLADALARVDSISWQPQALREHAERFDTALFRDRIARFVTEAVAEHQSRPARAGVRTAP